MVKTPAANTGNIRDTESIPGSGRSPGEGKGYPLQESGLENSISPWCHKESDVPFTSLLFSDHSRRHVVDIMRN